MSSSFRFGLWVGFVAGVTFAALWHSEQEGDADLSLIIVDEPPTDTVVVVEESAQEIDVTEFPTE